MIVCKICTETKLTKPGICNACCERLGIIAMPEITRPPRGCAKCNAMKFVRVIPREFSAQGWADSYLRDTATPMTLTQPPELDGGKFTGKPSLERGIGILEAWVCVGCDYVEWYCHTASQIPIGPEYMTEAVDFTPDSPYR